MTSLPDADPAYGPPPFHPFLPGKRMFLPAEEVTDLLRWYVADLRSQGDAAHELADLLEQITDDVDCSLIDYQTRERAARGAS